MSVTNPEIAGLFLELADLLELDGANHFRTRAYRNAAQVIDQTIVSLAEIALADPAKLETYDGIGKDLAAKILEITQSGTCKSIEEMRSKFPPSVVEMLRLPGIGPKKVSQLYRELNIASLDQLKEAAENGQLETIKGFGKKTAQTILDGLAKLGSLDIRLYLADIEPLALQILNDLKIVPGVHEGAVAGSVRRQKETIGDVDLLITADDSTPVMDALATHPLVKVVLARGDTKMRVRLNAIPKMLTPDAARFLPEMDLRVVPQNSFGAALQYFTGSKEHNVVLRQKAKDKGWSLNEYGLTTGENIIASKTEKDIYHALDLPYIPPELREHRQEFAYSNNAQIPSLIEVTDIQGDLHMHTTATDGTATIRQMIEGAIDRGLAYIAITDHSQRVQIANGLTSERLIKHWQDIRSVALDYPQIKVLCGVECDILENATLDLPADVLAQADWVLAVLHYGLNQPRSQIMDRLLMAIESPVVDCIGHLTGRYIQKRPGADVDVPAVIKAAKQHGVMLEINAHPARLDLNDVHAAAAKSAGIPIVINTDAHSVAGLDMRIWGIKQARRAGLTKNDVANSLPVDQLLKKLRRNK